LRPGAIGVTSLRGISREMKVWQANAVDRDLVSANRFWSFASSAAARRRVVVLIDAVSADTQLPADVQRLGTRKKTMSL
jgi:hypothetical protein